MSELTKELLSEVQEAKKAMVSIDEQKKKTPHTNYRYGYWTGYRDALNEAIRVHRRIDKRGVK